MSVRTNGSAIDVIGAGAVGLGLAVLAARAGHRVHLRGRRGSLTRAVLKAGDKTLESRFEGEPSTGGWVVIATKAPDVPAVLTNHAESVRTAAGVLMLQNGLGSLTASVLDGPFTGAVMYACAQRPYPGTSVWNGPARLVLDGSSHDATQWMQMLTSPWVSVDISTNFRRDVFRKLLINASINPVTALYRLSCDELRTRIELMQRVNTAADEVASLARSLGVEIGIEPRAMVERAIREMGPFRPSMLQDMELKRQTEVSALLDEPIALAENVGISTPALRALSEEIHSCCR